MKALLLQAYKEEMKQLFEDQLILNFQVVLCLLHTHQDLCAEKCGMSTEMEATLYQTALVWAKMTTTLSKQTHQVTVVWFISTVQIQRYAKESEKLQCKFERQK